MSEKTVYYRIRNILGVLGMVLPVAAVLTAGLVDGKESGWWYSISATYYNSPALTAILCAVALFLVCYDGYEKKDSVICGIAGYAALVVVAFPCRAAWHTGAEAVGLFQVDVTVSNLLHCAAAVVLFVSLGINSAFMFTLGEKIPTPEKKKRNRVYRVCGFGILGVLALFGAGLLAGLPDGATIVAETVVLWLFGISWLTKGGLFWADKT